MTEAVRATLILAIAKSLARVDDIMSGLSQSFASIAASEQLGERYVTRLASPPARAK